jgi:hypothetical protein
MAANTFFKQYNTFLLLTNEQAKFVVGCPLFLGNQVITSHFTIRIVQLRYVV